MNTKNLLNIQQVIDSSVAQKKVAGLNVLIYKDNKEVGYWQSGFASIEENKPFNRNTIVRLYSQSKPITAVAALILLEEGKIELNDEAGQYIPEFWNLQVSYDKGREGTTQKTQRPLLIQDLLNMTSGYTYGAWWDGAPLGEHLTSDFIQELNKDVTGDKKITTMDVAKRLAKIPVSFEPGTDYQYGLSADILGAVIEAVSGMKFSEFLKKRIFTPLGMNDTDFYVPENKQDRLADVYMRADNNTTLEKFTWPNLGISPDMKTPASFESGGAGLCSTIDDYLKFAQMLVNKGEYNGVRILQEKTVEFMYTARLRDNLQKKFDEKMEHLSGYTYCNLCRIAYEPGKCKALTAKGEFGWDGWLGPYVSIDVENKLVMLVLMQRTDAGTTNTTRKIKNIVYSSL